VHGLVVCRRGDAFNRLSPGAKQPQNVFGGILNGNGINIDVGFAQKRTECGLSIYFTFFVSIFFTCNLHKFTLMDSEKAFS
jgi:hypothetical protein